MKFQVERTVTIDGPKSKVRTFVEDFRHWNRWSPWTVLEPTCAVEVTGSANTPNHSMYWDGKLIGSGRNTLRSTDGKSLQYQLEFLKPWKSKAESRFYFDESNGQTKVTWTLNSSMPFFLFFMIPTMRNLIGMDYDRGLRMLKEVVEHGNIACKTTSAGITDHTGFSYLGIQRTVAFADMRGCPQVS